jgi:hypothetical protein
MTGATSRGVTPTVAKVTEPEVLAVSEELLRDLVGRAGDELRQSQDLVHAQIEVELMCFLGGCPPVGSDVHLGADIELGPIETVAGSSLGFLRASRTAWAVPGGCGVMVVLLGMVSTGRSALATAERNGARLATDVSSALEEGPMTTRSATPPDTHPGEEAQPGKRCEDVFEGLRAGPGTEGEVALRSSWR